MGGRPRTNPEQDRVLVKGRSSGEWQRLKSDIYLSLSVWHSTSITNFPRENLLIEAFSLTILSLTVLILLNYFTSSLSSTLSVWCSRNLRVHLSIGCHHYSATVPITIIETSGAIAGQARLLQLVIHGHATSNKSWLAIHQHYTLQEPGQAASR